MNLNLLLVEDNPDDQLIISSYLKHITEFSTHLVIKNNLEDGLKELEKKETEILLLDLSLPDSSGLEGLKRVLSHNEFLTVIILTGVNDNKTALKALKYGAQDYIIKDRLNEYVLEKSILYSFNRSKNDYEIRKSERKYKTLYNNSTNLLMSMHGQSGKIFQANTTTSRVTGYDSKEISSLHVSDLFYDNRLLEGDKIKTQIKKNGKIDQCETSIKTKKGKRIPVLFDLCINEDEPEHYDISLKDITYLKENERALKKAEMKTMAALLKGQESERKRMAKDLHDGLGQDVTGVSLMLDILQKQKSPDFKTIDKAVLLINRITREYRAITQSLHPAFITDGILSAIQKLCSVTENTFNIAVTFSCGDIIKKDLNLIKGNEIEIYRIIQEMINNSIKHGKATQVNITLEKRLPFFELTIEDNGKGFDLEALKNNSLKKGLGLKNLETRAAVINATYTIDSEQKKGTRIRLNIPVKQ